MVNSSARAMGILFPNSYDGLIPDLTAERLMASIPFGGRYRMIDFVLSSMVNSGMDNITVLVQQNYFSLIDHLGNGREWDLSRKNGGLTIVPPFAHKHSGHHVIHEGRVSMISNILGILKSQKQKYVIMSDTNLAMNFDFRALVDAHIESGADVTAVYKRSELPPKARNVEDVKRGMFFTYDIDNGRIKKIHINADKDGIQNFGMNIYILERERLIDMVSEAYVMGGLYFERDVLIPQLDTLNVQGYDYEGYVARISDLKSYFDANMALLDDANTDALFGKRTIYTKIRDDNPTVYLKGSSAKNVMAADGCVIEGEVENSILFRGVKIGKGAKVKNAILMQDTVIEDGVNIENIITDKKVTITKGKEMIGTETYPVFVAKRKVV